MLFVAAGASFVSMILIGNSIARDVNETLGTDFNGIWNLNGDRILKEHERLFPADRKRMALATAVVAAFGLFALAAFLPA